MPCCVENWILNIVKSLSAHLTLVLLLVWVHINTCQNDGAGFVVLRYSSPWPKMLPSTLYIRSPVICSYGLVGLSTGLILIRLIYCTCPVSLLLGYLVKRTVFLCTCHGTGRVLPVTRWCIRHFDIFLYFRTTTYHVAYFWCFLSWYYISAVLDSLFELLLPCGCPSR